ncbi:hypothetical protein evm_014794 [Chilo suppressalis]|nr:hypothetical protein evm_014794 [Chilo suppressalis]
MKFCVLLCQSYSDRRSDNMDGITFHLFPSNDNLKQQWISKLNRPDWTPYPEEEDISILNESSVQKLILHQNVIAF